MTVVDVESLSAGTLALHEVTAPCKQSSLIRRFFLT